MAGEKIKIMGKLIQILGFIICILCAVHAIGQTTDFWMLPANGGIYYGGCSIKNYEIIDTTQLVVCYYFTKDNDSLDVNKNDTTILQVGRKYTKFYGLKRHQADSVYTRKLSGIIGEFTPWENKFGQGIEYIIFQQYATDTIYNYHRMAFKDDAIMHYDEPIPQFPWVLGSETREIDGYLCYNARTRFKGRDWHVWYAVDIPVPLGPWKLSGLPGLILEASDLDNNYRFKMIGIAEKCTPILKYAWKEIKMSRQQWQSYDRNLHLHPHVTLSQAQPGVAFYIYDPRKDDLILSDDTWTIPYNPIERE